ncbi:MAG: arylesterase [Jhaorihella sp.]
MRKILSFLVFLLAGMAGGFAAAAGPVTIAALGDSLTQGYGLPQGDGFVPQMQAWLDERGADVTLINAGVSGDTTAGGAARVGWTLTPELGGMIVALGGNDLLRGIDPAETRANLETILKAAQGAGVAVLLVGMVAPGNFGPDYKAAFDAIYPDLAAQYGALYAESFLGGIAGPQADPADLLPYLQGDGIHPNAGGVARIVAALGPKVLELADRAAP